MRKHWISLLLLFPIVLCLAGCFGSGPPSPPPNPLTTVETMSGSGITTVGFTNADPHVQLQVTSDDPTCVLGTPNLGAGESDANGLFQFTQQCSLQQVVVDRYVAGDTQCSYFNANLNGALVDEYAPYVMNWGNAPPYILPCGQAQIMAVISPVSMISTAGPIEITMQANPGTFNSTWGMPSVYFSDDEGNLVGSISADSLSADGSTITFSSSPLIGSNGTAPTGNFLLSTFNLTSMGWVAINPTTGTETTFPPGMQPMADGPFTVNPPPHIIKPINPPNPCTQIVAGRVICENPN